MDVRLRACRRLSESSDCDGTNMSIRCENPSRRLDADQPSQPPESDEECVHACDAATLKESVFTVSDALSEAECDHMKSKTPGLTYASAT